MLISDKVVEQQDNGTHNPIEEAACLSPVPRILVGSDTCHLKEVGHVVASRVKALFAQVKGSRIRRVNNRALTSLTKITVIK